MNAKLYKWDYTNRLANSHKYRSNVKNNKEVIKSRMTLNGRNKKEKNPGSYTLYKYNTIGNRIYKLVIILVHNINCYKITKWMLFYIICKFVCIFGINFFFHI